MTLCPIDLICHATGARGRMYFRVPVDPREIQGAAERFSRVNDGHVVIATSPRANGENERVATAGLGHSTLL